MTRTTAVKITSTPLLSLPALGAAPIQYQWTMDTPCHGT